MNLRAVLALALVGVAVGGSPAVADNTVTVETPDCPRCRLFVESGDHVHDTYQLRHGRGTLVLDEGITSFALGVETNRGFSGISSLVVVAFQYRYFSVGSAVSPAQSRAGHQARICHAPVDKETIRFRVKRIPIPKSYFKRKGVIPPMPGQKFTLRAWASPTLSAVDDYDPTYKGVTAVQNDVCGSLPYQ